MATLYKKDAIYEQLKQSILSGEYAPGQQLPKELDFSRELGVAFNTLRSALKRLEQEHLVVRLRGRGTFVSEKPAPPKLLLLYAMAADRSYPWHQILPHLIGEAARHHIETTSFDYYEFSNLKNDQVKRFFARERIFGVIILGNSFTGKEPVVSLLKRRKVPVVIAPAFEEDGGMTGFASVVMDVRQAWRKALEHLRDRGYRRILTEVFLGRDDTIRRYTPWEYQALLQELNLSTDRDLWLITPPHDHEALQRDLLQKYHSMKELPDAIMCFTDFTANVVYQLLRELSYRIPEDVAVMGFCGALKGDFMQPSLSTIDLNYEEIARHALQLMLEADQWFDPKNTGANPPPRIVASFKLCPGEST